MIRTRSSMMTNRRLRVLRWFLAGLLVTCAVDSGAREIYRQKPPQAMSRPAAREAEPEEAAISFDGAHRGAISFDVRRDPASRSAQSGAIPVKLLDAGGRGILIVRVDCNFNGDPGRAALHLRGPEFIRGRQGPWDPLIPLDQGIEPGQTVHFDLTWDDETGEYGLFVDGRAVNPRPGTYNPATKEFGRSMPELANGRATQLGEPLPYPKKPFGAILAKVRSIVVGDAQTAAGICRNPNKKALAVDARVNNLVVAVDEPVVPVTKAHERTYDVGELVGTYTAEGVRLAWQPPVVHGINQGYYVYRRAGEHNARFEKLTTDRIYDLTYTDTAALPGQTYNYSVTAVYGNGRGGDVESKYPPEVTVSATGFSVASVAADKALYGAGQEIVVTLRGTPDAQARFTLAGVTREPVDMEEVDDGVYVGRVAVPAGATVPMAALTGSLALAGETATAQGPALGIDTTPPAAVSAGRILAEASWPGELEVSWQESSSVDLEGYRVYRSTSATVDTDGTPYAQVREAQFVDTAIVPGLTYRYAVVAVDRAGNFSAVSEVVSATALPGEGPAITGVRVDPCGRPLRPGQTAALTVIGQSGGQMTVDLGELTKVALAEQGRTGRYVGTYTVKDADLGPSKVLHRLVAHLEDAYGTSALAGPEVAIVGLDTLNDHTPPVIAQASHDGFQVAGFSGKLVAGDILTVALEGEPSGYASFTIQGVAEDLPLAESAGKPGYYTGTYTVGWEAEGVDVPVTVLLADEAGNETTGVAGQVSFDTRVRLLVSAKNTLLPADQKSTSRLVARATDANGDEVAGHELALTLSTTDEYTGVVGGGRIENREARMEDADNVEVRWGGVTDSFGEVAATYTAGFAAKTALILAKDLTTGDVGAGWLNTYVAATVALEIESRARAAKGAADQAILRLTADPPKLTADGRSTSRLTAVLTDLSGSPLPGKRVVFVLGNGNGRIRVLDSSTDDRGVAEAEYRAGTLMGTVTITASVQELGVTASVQIVLMADAPAKIELVASRAKLMFGEQAMLSVKVTDIHDNPNAEVPVTFQVLKGEGKLAEPEILTDRNGEGAVDFAAGGRPGVAIVEARHTSRAPTDEELRRVYGTVFVPRLVERQERDRIKVAEWLLKPGDEVEKGQELVTLEGGKGVWALSAPAKGIFVREVKHRRDRVELGETVGYIEIDPEVWETYETR